MNEKLTMITHDIGFAVEHLQEALHKSNAVESIIILDLIRQAVELKNGVERLHLAWKEDRTPEHLTK
jgi:hypothetical protein